jgi:transposase-like protein
MKKCPHCANISSVKVGVRKNKCGWIQRYRCTKCKKYFTDRKGFKNFRHKSEVITAALDLRAKGLSLRDVVDHLDQHHKVKVSRQTILDWENKFTKKLKSFTQSLLPELSGFHHADEMFVKAKQRWIFYWDDIDYFTKFLVADHVSDERNDEEAIKFLNKIKKGSPEIPQQIVTDCSYDYPPAMKKVFPRKKIHRPYPAWRKKFQNNPIERLHNTLKQRYKVFRTFHCLKTAKDFFDFYKIYYNFIRKHMTLNEITPAQAAKIHLSLKRNRFLSLIEI